MCSLGVWRQAVEEGDVTCRQWSVVEKADKKNDLGGRAIMYARELSEVEAKDIRYVHMLPREARDEWMKEMHEKPKLSMIAECEVKSNCSLLKSKGDRRMMHDVKIDGCNCAPLSRWRLEDGLR